MKALITGATSGIGYSFSYLLAKEGYDVILVGRKENILVEMKESIELEYKVKAQYLLCDLAIPEQVEILLNDVKNLELDMFINNAGFDISGEFDLVDEKYIDEMIQVNMITFTKLLRAVIIRMKENGVKGKILNVSSIVASLVMPYSAVYAGTKSYIYGLSLSLREECKNLGITITTLCPGPTKSNFAKRASVDNSKAFEKNAMSSGQVAMSGYKGLINNKVIVVPGFKNKFYVFISRFVTRKFMLKTCGSMIIRKDYYKFLNNRNSKK